MSLVFEVVVADGVVIGSSHRRLPFEPKGSAVEYRRQLREAVSTLQARSGEVLSA